MNISWVLADSLVLDPTVDLKLMKDTGPLWGSWKTWRGCQTDNVICHELSKGRDLINREFHTICNFYIPNSNFITLERPENVLLYEGAFLDDYQPEEIVAMHLAGGSSDIVLLLGLDLTEKEKSIDKLTEHRAHVYRTLVKHAIEDNPEVQWVLVDHPAPVMKMLSKLPNLTSDTMSNCLGLKDL
jgi:hypothetical protein